MVAKTGGPLLAGLPLKGILINEEEIKVTLFADYMTCFPRDIASHHRLLATLHIFFKTFFNLQVNNDKTEIFASIKILGIVFHYHTASRMRANFDLVLKSIKDILNMWKWRGKNSDC